MPATALKKAYLGCSANLYRRAFSLCLNQAFASSLSMTMGAYLLCLLMVYII